MNRQAGVLEVLFTLVACLLFTYGALGGKPLAALASIPFACAAVALSIRNPEC